MRTRRSHARPGIERKRVAYTLSIPIATYTRARLVAARLGVTTRQYLHAAIERSITVSPINPNDSEGARDRAAHAAGAAAALKNAQDLPAADSTVSGNNMDDKARAAKMNTSTGARCDYEQLRL